MQPENNHVRRHKNEIMSKTNLSNLHRDNGIKVILTARPLITPVAQKLCRCKRAVYSSASCCEDFSKKEYIGVADGA
jgi:hypothetical protein